MNLDVTDLQILKTEIDTNPTLAGYAAAGGNADIVRYLAEPASPAVPVWRHDLSHAEMLNNYDFTELDNLTDKKQFQLSQITALGTIDTRKTNVRDGLNEVFAAVSLANTRTALINAGRRDANRGEALFASAPVQGAGVLDDRHIGEISLQNVRDARALA